MQNTVGIVAFLLASSATASPCPINISDLTIKAASKATAQELTNKGYSLTASRKHARFLVRDLRQSNETDGVAHIAEVVSNTSGVSFLLFKGQPPSAALPFIDAVAYGLPSCASLAFALEAQTAFHLEPSIGNDTRREAP